MSLRVTRVRIDRIEPKHRGICAEVTVVIEDEIAIHRVTVINGERGLFVSMPNTGHPKIVNNKKRCDDLVHPLSSDLGREITRVVLEAYEKQLETIDA